MFTRKVATAMITNRVEFAYPKNEGGEAFGERAYVKQRAAFVPQISVLYTRQSRAKTHIREEPLNLQNETELF